ncbi:MAG: orotate phosphoribosyltransferase [Gammaproteobacteria bacterium]|nr:orotate phosphoribosyltransferase [Gammaproteobacteria bacterium]
MTLKADLAKKVRETSKLSGSFTLRSGVVSDTYFDKYLFESDPNLLRSICEEMSKLVPSETEILAGLEMGGIPVVTMLSQLTGIPSAYVRKNAKEYGTCKYAEGPSLIGKKVSIIEDVVSSGGAIIDALEMMAGDKIAPIPIICVIDRQTGGSENLMAKGYKLQSVFNMTEIENALYQAHAVGLPKGYAFCQPLMRGAQGVGKLKGKLVISKFEAESRLKLVKQRVMYLIFTYRGILLNILGIISKPFIFLQPRYV